MSANEDPWFVGLVPVIPIINGDHTEWGYGSKRVGNWIMVIYPFTFGRAQLTYGEYGAIVHEGAWDYDTPERALQAMDEWDGIRGEPEGWVRHPPSKRRQPDGDPTRQYYAE